MDACGAPNADAVAALGLSLKTKIAYAEKSTWIVNGHRADVFWREASRTEIRRKAPQTIARNGISILAEVA